MHRFSVFSSEFPRRRVGHAFMGAPLLIGAIGLAFVPHLARAGDGVAGVGLQGGWQARAVGLGLEPRAEPGLRRESFSLFGDYYFAMPGIASDEALRGGFRATGGVFVGPRSGLGLAAPAGWPGAAEPTATRGFGLALPQASRSPYAWSESSVPYVGIGYSGLKALRATGGGWGFSADLGVMALQPRSAVRFGQQPAYETLRELQFSPLLQVGASYSF